MPVRRETARAKRLNDRVIAELYELIREGAPWNITSEFRSNRGVAELRGLITGHFYFTDIFKEEDEETKKFVYESVRDELVPAHAHYRPGSRPWGWWEYDSPEPRLIIGRDCLDPTHDDDCEGHDNGHLPAAEDPDLPEWARGLFCGRPSVYDGHLYEDEYTYLERLNLLLPEEIAIFEKHDSVINVYVAQGELGKCRPCWERAREIAASIDFDLDKAIEHFEFWIPGDLYLECEHLPHNGPEGIFRDAD